MKKECKFVDKNERWNWTTMKKEKFKGLNFRKGYQTGRKEVLEVLKKRLKFHNQRIEECLDFCRKQNGLPYCKNCNLCKENLFDLEILNKLEK